MTTDPIDPIEGATRESARPAGGYDSRSAARILAVQALYQMDIAQTPLDDIISEFVEHRLDKPLADVAEVGELGEITLPPADSVHFEAVLRGVMEHQRLIDGQVSNALRVDWKLSRLDSTLRALLRAGAYEILCRSDVPPAVIVSEYTDMAHAFFEGAEAGMANALLDRLVKEKAEKDKV